MTSSGCVLEFNTLEFKIIHMSVTWLLPKGHKAYAHLHTHTHTHARTHTHTHTHTYTHTHVLTLAYE